MPGVRTSSRFVRRTWASDGEGTSTKPKIDDSQELEVKATPADRQPHDANDKSDFIPYPTNRVVGIIDDAGDVQGALNDLKAAGFGLDDIRLLTGEAGARRIDIKGDEHGRLAHVVRSVQEVLGSYEIEHLTRYEQELLAGHFGIGVIAHDVQGQDKVRQILKAHHGHFINYYSRWVVEYLEP